MNLPLVMASMAGLAALTVVGGLRSDAAPMAVPAAAALDDSGLGGAEALLGQGLYGSEAPIDRWGDPVRAEALALEPLGRVAGVLAAPDGTPEAIVVAVGGIWGIGARQVEVSLKRVHLLGADDGDRLVVDLSASGAEPGPG